jgi:glutathione peroxidase
MKKVFLLIALIMFALTIQAKKRNFHDFTVETITGEDFNLSSLKGKKVLVVNVASKCGLTPQYKLLQELYSQYGPDKFVIIGFPANNFGKQEPGTNEEIQEFCKQNYGVTFLMMAKISVKGEDIAPLYKWLTSKSENGKKDAEVTWNFQKFFINESGEWDGFVEPKTSPLDKTITNWIEGKK